MTEKFKILGKFIKDMSSETPNIETYLYVRDRIAKYQLGIDINSKALKNQMIEINTTFKYVPSKKITKKEYKKNTRDVEIYNLGTNKFITVKYSIKTVLNILKFNPKIYYSGGSRGWIGDSPKIYLDTNKIKKIGWKPKKTIEESIKETINFFIQNKWLFK